MVGQIVDISENDRYLKVSRGFFVVCDKEAEVGRVPLDDLQAVIAHGFGHTYSQNVLVELSNRGVPLVLCNKRHMPHAMVWPLDNHTEQTKRVNGQINCKRPKLKQAWKSIVQSKIAMQSSVLKAANGSDDGLHHLSSKVKSDDVANVEAWAARRYWRALFGDDFRRDQDRDDVNACLNYGYTLLRSLVARSVVAAGLHPTVAIHHSNRGNAYALVDDLMEPYRPVVDWHCYKLDDPMRHVDSEVKMFLAKISDYDLPSDLGMTPLHLHIDRMVTSYVGLILGERKGLALPTGFSLDVET